MHGSHLLTEEYQISASRLDPPRKSSDNFNFCRSKMKAESSPKCKQGGIWQFIKDCSKIIFALVVIVKGISRSIGPSNTLKLYAGTQVIISYIAPKLFMFKRSFVIGKVDNNKSVKSVPKIIEIFPAPLHLVIALNGLEEGKKILKKDAAALLITPNRNISTELNSTDRSKLYLDTNSTTIFESLAFSWCEAFKKNKRYPTRLIVTGPARISSCVLGQYQWALKIPKEIISFRAVNSSEISPNFSECPADRKDIFDCRSKDREDIRFKYSQMCPDLTPFLLACSNRVTLERALAYKPRWADNKKGK